MQRSSHKIDSLESIDPEKSQLINFDKIIKNENLEDVAEKLIESTFVERTGRIRLGSRSKKLDEPTGMRPVDGSQPRRTAKIWIRIKAKK